MRVLVCVVALLLAAMAAANIVPLDVSLTDTEQHVSVVLGSNAPPGELIRIPLTPSYDSNRRDVILMQLKQRLMSMSMRSESLLETEREVPLDVEILSTKHLATYYGTIQIGPPGKQTSFKVLFDTGSCEFWVPSEECNTVRCKRHSRMPNLPGLKHAKARMNIQYLSGKVAGKMIYETVTLGDIQVDGQVVGLGKTVDIELLDDVRWDGILGLAYPNPTLSAQGITPIFDTIISSHVLTKKGLSNQFAYYISDHMGSVTFGGADCDLISKGDKAGCINKFKFVPVTEKTYWTITIKDVHIKYPGQASKSVGCPAQGCKAIVDTGTYLIYGPEGQVSSMLASTLKTCADYSKMPVFTFIFHTAHGEAPVEISLDPKDYILKFNLGGRKDCVVGISPDKDTIWTLGQVFLRSFYTVFDRDADRIGFARLPRHGFPAINTPDVVKKANARAAEHEAKAPPTNHHPDFKKKTTKKQGFMERMHRVEENRLHHLDSDRFAETRLHELRHSPRMIETEASETRTNTADAIQHTPHFFDGPRHVHFQRANPL